MCMAGQLTIEPTDGAVWTLAGEIQEPKPLQATMIADP